MRILASLVCMKENYLSRRSCGLRIADIAGYKAFHACRRVACFGGGRQVLRTYLRCLRQRLRRPYSPLTHCFFRKTRRVFVKFSACFWAKLGKNFLIFVPKRKLLCKNVQKYAIFYLCPKKISRSSHFTTVWERQVSVCRTSTRKSSSSWIC